MGGKFRDIREKAREFYLPISFGFGALIGIYPTGTTAELQGLELAGCAVVTGLMMTALGWLLFDLTEDSTATD